VHRRLWLIVVALVLALVPGLFWLFERRLEHSQDPVILEAARRYQVEPALIKAVIWKESHFDPRAEGRSGEIGLMQLMDPASQEWASAAGVYPLPAAHLYHPLTNALAGTWYLKKLLERYRRTDDPTPFALADYNAGRANVLRWAKGAAATNSAIFIQHIGFPGTQRYVRAVLQQRERYRGQFGPKDLAGAHP